MQTSSNIAVDVQPIEPIILSSGGDDIQYLVHISDIHIRLSSRFEEYRHVLQTFVAQLPSIPNALVVITGDLFHHKNELTPDCIMFAIHFLQSIATHHPILIIPGNHDLLVDNTDKHDSITSILYHRPLVNVHYLKASGVYQFNNILFVHNSLWNPTEWIHPHTVRSMVCQDLNSPFAIVSLYHGMVGSCRTLQGYELQSNESTLSLAMFDDSDLVLLGDIHHHQYLKPHIAYAGSMISQNFNETDEHHGFLLWNVHDKTSQFHILHNPFAFRRIDVRSGMYWYLDTPHSSLENVLEKMSSTMRVEVHLHDESIDDTNEIKRSFHKKGFAVPRIRHAIHHDDSVSSSSSSSSSSHTHSNDLRTMLTSYVDAQGFKHTKEIVEAIVSNVDVFHSHNHANHHDQGGWRIVELEFDNMFGYGQNNRIRFKNHSVPQLVGIFGSNSSGKSTLIDILLFMLYGKITRYALGNSTPPELIHKNKKQMSGRLVMEIGREEYTILKKATRHPKTQKIKVTEQLWKVVDGQRVNLTEEHRFKTDKVITQLIGTPEQFIFLSLCTQTPTKPFREMTQKERKDFLQTLFRLDAFDSYFQRLQQEMKDWMVETKCMETTRSKLLYSTEEMWTSAIQQVEDERTIVRSKLKCIAMEMTRLRSVFTEHCRIQSVRQQLQSRLESLETDIVRVEKEISNLPDVFEENDLKNDDSIDDVQRRLDDTRQSLSRHRRKLNALYDKSNSTIPSPSSNDFSFREWNRHRRRSTFHHSPRRLTSIPTSSPPDDFRFFGRQTWMDLETQWTGYEQTIVPKILRSMERRDGYLESIKTLDASIQHLEEEYAVHQHVRYNDDCPACRDNSFRKRKVEIERRLQTLTLKKQHLETKLGHNQEMRDRWVKRLTKKPFATFYTSSPNPTSSSGGSRGASPPVETETQLRTMVEIVKKGLKDRLEGIATFENIMTRMLERRLDDFQRREEERFGEMTLYLESLNTFLDNRQRKVERKTIEEEMERLEDRCREYEEMIHQYVQKTRQRHLQTSLKRWTMERDALVKELGDVDERWQCLEKENVSSRMKRKESEYDACVREESGLDVRFEQLQRGHAEFKELSVEWERSQQRIARQQMLIKICHRDGFPLHILRTYLSRMNVFMNQVLEHFLDHKSVAFEIVDDGDVIFQTKSHDSDMCLHFYGGMESLMIDLATKITFARFGYLPTSSFFVLDENISVMDEFHLTNIHILFRFLKQHFQHILLISHLPSMKNIVDNDVHVHKNEQGYAHIRCDL